MNTTQVATMKPMIYVKNAPQLCPSFHFKPCTLPMGFDPLSVTSKSGRIKPSFVLQCVPILKSRQPLHVCLAGGRGMMDNNEDSQRKYLEKAMEKLKGQSIEDILQQLQKGENGGKPPRGRGGGGSGDSGNIPGGSEDGGSDWMHETLQVVLATISFICLYILFINGLELAKLARDYIKFLSGGRQSARLKQFTYNWRRFYKIITEKLSSMGLRKPSHGCSSLMSSEVSSLLKHYMKSNPDE